MYEEEQLKAFTKNYRVVKHARFELQPVAETAAWIEKHHILSLDESLKRNAGKLMAYCDKYYAEVLQGFIKAKITRETEFTAAFLATALEEYITYTLCKKEADFFSIRIFEEFDCPEKEKLLRMGDAHFLFDHYFILRRQNLLSVKRGSFAYRAEENYKIFRKNIEIYGRYKAWYPREAEAFEKEFENAVYFTDVTLYQNLFCIQKTDTYNRLVSGDLKTDGINRRMAASSFGKWGRHKKILLLQKLHRQLLFEPENNLQKTGQELPLCFGRPKFLARPWKLKHRGVFGNCDHGILQKEGIYYYMITRPAELFGRGRIKLSVTDEPSGEEQYILMDADKETDACRAIPYLTLCAKPVKEYFRTQKENFSPDGTDAEVFYLTKGFSAPVPVTKELYEGYQEGRYRTDREFLEYLIAFFKAAVLALKSFEVYGLSRILKEPGEYDNLRQFYKDIDRMTYKVNYKYLSARVLEQAVEQGEVYLFRIASADLYKERCKDVFSLYLRYFMSEENREKSDLMLNGSPRLLYRPSLTDGRITHPKGSILVNKRYAFEKEKERIADRVIPDKAYMAYYNYYNFGSSLTEEEKQMLPYVKTSVSDKDLIKDAHYAREQFSITLSFTINPEVSQPVLSAFLNRQVVLFKEEKRMNVLEIYRGKEHFLSYSIFSPQGEQLEEGSLDTVSGIPYRKKIEEQRTKVFALMAGKEPDLEKAYKRTGNLRGLHDAYLGDCVTRLVSKAVSYNAVIRLTGYANRKAAEDSLMGKQLYKRFETVLFTKLSCYVKKELPPHAPGGMLNPLQLVTGDNQNKKQNGIVFLG